MSFKKKKVYELKEYKNIYDIIKYRFSPAFIINTIIVLLAIFGIIYATGPAIEFGKKSVKSIGIWSMKILAEKAGEEMQHDYLGQINVLIAGYGGENHQGGFLTDTLMVASYNPKLGAVTFLSLPRDLYIKYPNGGTGRINGLFPNVYRKDKDMDKASTALANKISEITSIPINYYAMIDFNGFEGLINSVGGIEVDVPENLTDTQYPTPSGGYTTFSVKKGIQYMNGATALKYARSRHSTSDFSRAYRQQLIIKGLVNKILAKENLTNIGRIQSLYGEYNKMVHTNISIKNMIGMVKYLDKLNHYFSFVLTAECNSSHYTVMNSGCFLYYPNRDAFGGASVILPKGSHAGNLSNYKKIQDFAHIVVYNQDFLIENPEIKVINGVDRKLSKKAVANDFAVELRNYGFNITTIENSKEPQNNNTIFINGTGNFEGTINTLRMFIGIDEILTGNIDYGNNLTIIIGNNFIK